MLIQSIQLTNFLSHSDTKLELKADQKLLVDGISGSGKSSLIEAVVWGLYGRGRADNRSLIKRGALNGSVTIVLDDNGISYKIERKINQEGKHELKLTRKKVKAYAPVKVNGIKDTQEFIESKILGCSYLLFINSVICPQDNSENFVKQNASKRKELLLEIIKATKYDGYYDVAKNKLKDTKESLISFDTKIDTLKESIKDEKFDNILELEKNETRIKTDIKKKDNDIIEVNKKLFEVSDKFTKIDSKKEEFKKVLEKKVIVRDKIKLLSDKIEKINDIDVDNIKRQFRCLQDAREMIKVYEEEEKKAREWDREYLKINDEKPALRNFEDELAEINRQLIKVMTSKLPVCKNCNTPYSEYEEKKKTDQKLLEERLDIVTRNKEDYDKQMIDYNKKVEELDVKPKTHNKELDEQRGIAEFSKDYELYYAQLPEREDRLKEAESDLDEKTKELKTLFDEEKELIKFIEDNSNESEELGKIESALKLMESDKELLDEQYKAVLNQLSSSNEAKKRAENIGKEIKQIEKDSKKLRDDEECLELIKEAFGSTGVKAILIDYIIPQLEDRINEVLEKLSDFRIKLDTQRNSVADESKTVEGLFISIVNAQGEELDFGSYSGGEKMRIDAAIFEGLASLSKLRFRVYDESIVGLDEDTIENFTQVMFYLKERIQQMLCISHLGQIKELFEDRIEIVKINGTSKINKE